MIAAVWGGRVVSESALTTRINAARTAIGDSGKDQRLIRTFPRKGVRFVGEVLEETGLRDEAVAAANHSLVGRLTDGPLALPDKPSIVVLPFQNISSDPEQDYFADGMTEEIITALSRFKAVFVIARNTSFTYKGKAVDIKNVGRELGVRYALEGSVRKAGERVRISGQLIEAATGTHLWVDTFNGEQKGIFELQDEVTRSVVGAIAPRLFEAEVAVTRRKPSQSLERLRSLSTRHGDR